MSSVIKPLFVLSVVTYVTAVLVIHFCVPSEILTVIAFLNIVLSILALFRAHRDYVVFFFVFVNIVMSLIFLDFSVNGDSRFVQNWTDHFGTGSFLLLVACVLYVWGYSKTNKTKGDPAAENHSSTAHDTQAQSRGCSIMEKKIIVDSHFSPTSQQRYYFRPR